MTQIAVRLCAVMALIAAATLALSFAEPAMAEENARNLQVTMKVLASANARVHADILELQQLKIAVPIGTEAYYSAGVKEQNLAKAALESGNLDFVKDHAMKAMNHFKTASDLLASVKELEKPTLIEGSVNEKVDIREDRSSYLQTLATTNKVSANFADYHLAIQASKAAIVRQDLREAEDHLARAEAILDGIQIKIQTFGDSNKGERVKAFAEDMKAHLSKVLAKAESDSTMTGRKTLMLEVASAIRLLENTVDVDEIIKITADSSRIQVLLREYGVVLSDLDVVKETEETNEPSDDGKDEVSDIPDDVPDNSGSNDCDNSGSGSNDCDQEDDEAKKLVKTADELEDRANKLLAESNNAVATVKINSALALIATARIDIDAGHYDVAMIGLKSADNALDVAEELIR